MNRHLFFGAVDGDRERVGVRSATLFLRLAPADAPTQRAVARPVVDLDEVGWTGTVLGVIDDLFLTLSCPNVHSIYTNDLSSNNGLFKFVK